MGWLSFGDGNPNRGTPFVIRSEDTNQMLNSCNKRHFLGGSLAIILLILAVSGLALGETPITKIPLNPDFAYPVKETTDGIEVNSASLVENASAWDGRVVVFKGEAIGEAMARGKMAWIHLNDDAYMWKNIEEGAKLKGYNSGHAVWVPAEMGIRIRFFGDFKHEGDVVKVVGIFHAACPEHGGDMDIHATTLEVVRFGHPVRHVINASRAILAAILIVLALILYQLRMVTTRRHA